MRNYLLLLCTARKRSLGQGNVFTSVCLSTGGGGLHTPGCRPPCRQTWGVGQTPRMQIPAPHTDPLDADPCPPHTDAPGCRPPGMQTPPQDADPPPRYGQQAGGTHPTGVHTFLQFIEWTKAVYRVRIAQTA